MIIEKPGNTLMNDNDPDPDSPPSYDTLVVGPGTATVAGLDRVSGTSRIMSTPSSSSNMTTTGSEPFLVTQASPYFYSDSKSSSSPHFISSSSSARRVSSGLETNESIAAPAQSPGSPAGWFAKWLGTPQARTDHQVRHTVLGLLRDLVKQEDTASSISILQSCADACRSRGLSFESIIQEPNIQGHTPLYWAIIKSSFSSEPGNHLAPDHGLSPSIAHSNYSLVEALCSAPLKPETYADALQACILTSSHQIFTCLSRHNPLSQDSMLTEDSPGSNVQSDTVDVTNGDESLDAEESAMSGAFRVNINIVEFQKRMRIMGSIRIEFIARGRMWALTSLIYSPQLKYPVNLGRDVSPGSWILLLDLIEHSPATWIDSRLTIIPPKQLDPEPPASSSGFSFSKVAQGRSKIAPIVFRMRSPGSHQLSGETRDKTKSWDNSRGPIMVSLSEHPQGSSLQFDGCPYIREDGSLRMLFEAKLIRPGNECVFM